MIQQSINLPFNKRLDLHLVNRRDLPDEDKLAPELSKIFNIKKGSKLSRYFRHIFENKNIKKLFGAYIALSIAASAFIPPANAIATGPAEDTLIAQTKLVLTTEKGIQYPVESVKITQNFRFYHPGIDLDGITGDIIKPIMNGVVEAIDYSKYAYGNAVYVNHGGGVTSLYAHLSKILVQQNQEVNGNTVIGLMGATGYSKGDHLHLEVRQYGTPINPLSVLP